MTSDSYDYSLIFQEATLMGCTATLNEPLRNHSNWRIGGDADLFLEPASVIQAARLLRVISDAGIPFVVIGQGSNLLITDDRIRGVVLKVGSQLSRINVQGNRICAEAGAWVPSLAGRAMKEGLTGLEHVVGIPGTIGGLVVMNGGSHQKNIGGSVRRIRALTLAGAEIEFARGDCRFDYRSSIFQDGRHVVTSVELELEYGDLATIHHTMLTILRERRKKFPLKQPNCGSVFLAYRTGSTIWAPGKLIEDAGLKGLTIGGAQVSMKHANFIVNCGNARASDVIGLIHSIHETVLAKTGVSLCCEIKYIDENCRFVPILENR